MNVPSLTATLATGAVLYHWLKPMDAQQVAQTSQSPGWGGCNAKYCDMDQTQVDRAVNTTLRDDTLGGPTLRGASQYVAETYRREASEHPGVHLVAHTVM
jgi:hypothetical protein